MIHIYYSTVCMCIYSVLYLWKETKQEFQLIPVQTFPCSTVYFHCYGSSIILFDFIRATNPNRWLLLPTGVVWTNQQHPAEKTGRGGSNGDPESVQEAPPAARRHGGDTDQVCGRCFRCFRVLGSSCPGGAPTSPQNPRLPARWEPKGVYHLMTCFCCVFLLLSPSADTRTLMTLTWKHFNPDGQTDRQRGVRTDRRTDGQTDGRTDTQADGQTDRQTDISKCLFIQMVWQKHVGVPLTPEQAKHFTLLHFICWTTFISQQTDKNTHVSQQCE